MFFGLDYQLLPVGLTCTCHASVDEWPSSWEDAELVAPEFRALIPEDIWERWRERRRKEDEEERAAEARKSQNESDGEGNDEGGSSDSDSLDGSDLQ